jgi:hypothetical protein
LSHFFRSWYKTKERNPAICIITSMLDCFRTICCFTFNQSVLWLKDDLSNYYIQTSCCLIMYGMNKNAELCWTGGCHIGHVNFVIVIYSITIKVWYFSCTLDGLKKKKIKWYRQRNSQIVVTFAALPTKSFFFSNN